MERKQPSVCTSCGGRTLFTRKVASAGGHGPHLLHGLGGFFHTPKFDVYVCSACGHCSYFAERDAVKKLPTAKGWERVN